MSEARGRLPRMIGPVEEITAAGAVVSPTVRCETISERVESRWTKRIGC